MSTAPSSKLQYQEQRERDHQDRLDECKALLDQLDDGIYTIDLENSYRPANGDVKKNLDGDSIIILVETNLDLKRIIHFKKPLLIKKITVSNNDISYLESWTHDQIIELNSKLVLILHGFCVPV